MRRAALACGWLLLAAASAGAQGAPLRWPLALQPALSSTFGETRAVTFHMGIDLKTWGKTGYEVHAVGDGWIERLRTSPWGYGRALYQRLDDGRIAVYAHLSAFAGTAGQRVRAAQREGRQYSVDLWLERGQIPVRRGQVIALTGQAGAGPPHLHLELRDADNVPLNPLLSGLGPIADTTPPTLRRLAVLPLDPAATVDGRCEPAALPLSWSPAREVFEASRPIRVWGRVGLAIEDYDRADAAPNEMAALQHELVVDGRTVATCRYERIPYGDNHQVALDRLRPTADPGAVFSALYRRPGNRLPFYATLAGGDGALQCGPDGLHPGTHEVLVTVADAAGNQARSRVALHVAAPPRIDAARLEARGDDWLLQADLADEDSDRLAVDLVRLPAAGAPEPVRHETVGAGSHSWKLPRADAAAWELTVADGDGGADTRTLAVPVAGAAGTAFELEIRVRPALRHALLEIHSPRPLRQVPTVLVEGARALPARQTAPWTWQAVVPLGATDPDGVVVAVAAVAADGAAGRGRRVLSGQAARPGRAGTLAFLDGEAQLQVEAGSAYEVLVPQADRFAPVASEGLVAIGSGCHLGPADAAFDRPARLTLRIPAGADAARAGLYAESGRGGRWVFVGNERDAAGDLVGAPVRALGRFALMVDATPPEVVPIAPAAGTDLGPAAQLSARVRDAGSGIGREEDVVLELDGERLVSEYDPEADRVIADPDPEWRPGDHELVLTVRDQAGNETVRRVGFRVR